MSFTIHINHSPIIQSLLPNYELIAEYYAEVPSFGEMGQNTLVILGSWMTALDRANYYGLERFDTWFSNVNRKIADGVITDPLANDAAIDLSTALVNGQISFWDDCKGVTRELFLRGFTDALKQYLYLLILDGIFEPITGLLYQVEFNNLPRWQTLGLSNPPSILECEQAILLWYN
jgi:hypothetical protein